MDLMGQVTHIRMDLVQKDKSYREAVEEFGYLKDQAGLLEGTRQKIVAFAKKREQADREVKAADAKVGLALDGLKKAMKEADPKGPERAPAALEAERQTILAEWGRRAESAPDAPTLNQDGALKALQALAKKSAEAAQDPGKANAAADLDKAQKGFEAARAETDKAIEPVRRTAARKRRNCWRSTTTC